jgi:hypothetical protein
MNHIELYESIWELMKKFVWVIKRSCLIVLQNGFFHLNSINL